MSLTSVDLPEPLTPVTAMSWPSGKETVRLRRLCSARRAPPAPAPGCAGGAAGASGSTCARQVRPGDRLRVLQQRRHRAAVHDLAAVLAGARTDVDDPVGDPDGVLVVLHHDQRVAQAAQPQQRLDQPVVVPLVQADGGLVEHVEHADQAGTDLGGEPDALRLAAGERPGRAVQGEVVQTDVEQELQSGVDLLEHPLGDHLLPVGQLDAGQQLGRLADGQVADLGDALAGQGDREHLGLESGAAAGRAGTSRM